ncbi:MAG: hypothetical protein RLY17_1872, partial [Pseudomonadota bacterium]
AKHFVTPLAAGQSGANLQCNPEQEIELTYSLAGS